MLILSRKPNEDVVIRCAGAIITIKVTRVDLETGQVKLGFTAPPEVLIARKELLTKPKETEHGDD